MAKRNGVRIGLLLLIIGALGFAYSYTLAEEGGGGGGKDTPPVPTTIPPITPVPTVTPEPGDDEWIQEAQELILTELGVDNNRVGRRDHVAYSPGDNVIAMAQVKNVYDERMKFSVTPYLVPLSQPPVRKILWGKMKMGVAESVTVDKGETESIRWVAYREMPGWMEYQDWFVLFAEVRLEGYNGIVDEDLMLLDFDIPEAWDIDRARPIVTLHPDEYANMDSRYINKIIVTESPGDGHGLDINLEFPPCITGCPRSNDIEVDDKLYLIMADYYTGNWYVPKFGGGMENEIKYETGVFKLDENPIVVDEDIARSGFDITYHITLPNTPNAGANEWYAKIQLEDSNGRKFAERININNRLTGGAHIPGKVEPLAIGNPVINEGLGLMQYTKLSLGILSDSERVALEEFYPELRDSGVFVALGLSEDFEKVGTRGGLFLGIMAVGLVVMVVGGRKR